MAIVLKYGSPGPLLQAGFAAGIGHRKNAQQEDLLKIWQQQTQQGFQAQQAALDRNQRTALQENQQDFLAGQQVKSQDFQYWNTKYHVDSQANQAQMGRNFAAGQAAKSDQKRFYHDAYFKLPPIPEHADAATRTMLTKKRNSMLELMGPKWDQSQPDVQKAWQDEYDAYTSAVSGLNDSYSPAANANKHTIYRDPTGKAFDEPGEGRIGYDERNGQQIDSKAQAAAQKQQEKTRADQQKQAEKFQSDSAAWSKALHAKAVALQKADAEASGSLEPKPLDSFRDQAEKELGAFGIKPPQPPQQPSTTPAPGTNQNAYEKFQGDTTPAQQQAGQSRQVPGFPGVELMPNGVFLFHRGEAGQKSMLEMERKAQEDPGWANRLRAQIGQAAASQPVSAASTKAPETTAAQDEAFNAQWATLRPGQSLRGPDGTIYIKKAQ